MNLKFHSGKEKRIISVYYYTFFITMAIMAFQITAFYSSPLYILDSSIKLYCKLLKYVAGSRCFEGGRSAGAGQGHRNRTK